MKRYFYLLLLLFTAITGFYFFYSWAQLPVGHRYIYPIDDVYIHLALARNFAELGVWSVNTVGFDSASSSILYTLMLTALIKCFGDWEYYPLLLNIIFGYLTLYAVYRYIRDFGKVRDMKLMLILLLPFSLLYMMALIGMEHSIHMFLIVTAVYYIQKCVKNHFRNTDFLLLLVLTFFLAIVRFESMFFTAALAFALFLRRNFGKGMLVLIFGFFPIVLFGLISVRHGGYFFPNSVMVKGSYPAGNHILQSVWQIFSEGVLFNRSFYKCLFFPFAILAIDLFRKYRHGSWQKFFSNETATIVVVAVGILQALFAFLKYRYENYVMIAVLLLIVPIISETYSRFKHKNIRKSDWLIAANAVAVFLIAFYRFGYHHLPLTYSSKGIYEQQVEMSRFIYDYYKGEKVLANDIGAISYFSHVKLTDMVGLGSTDIAEIKVKHKHLPREVYVRENKKFIQAYAKREQVRIAVIYPEWFPGGPPANWIPVASWRSPGAFGPAIDRIVFYALTPEEVAPLQKHLQQFNLDKNVEQWFYILKYNEKNLR